jgi:hypothetical protein
MPWWGWVIIMLIALVGLSMLYSIRKVRSLAASTDPTGYFARATHRMDEVEKVSESVENLIAAPGLNKHRVSNGADKLRMLAESQRRDSAPPELEDHKLTYYKIMDLAARRAEDYLRTGGVNLGKLAEEQERLNESIQEQLMSTTDSYRKTLAATGILQLMCENCGQRGIDVVLNHCPRCGSDNLAPQF